MIFYAHLWLELLDQTSFRTEGNVVVFVLTKMYTKKYIYTHNFPSSHRPGREGGMREEGWEGQGLNQLTRSKTHNTVLYTFGLKISNDIYKKIPFLC